MWTLATTDDYDRSHKWYQKKRPKELGAVLDNLDTYFQALQAGTKPLQIKAGFIHPEPMGVIAIDQKGGGKNLAQTRLYVYPDQDDAVLHLITLGDKKSQKQDIQMCKQFVEQLNKDKEQNQHESEEEIP